MASIWLHYLGDERYDFPKPGPIPGLERHYPGDKIEFTDDLLAEFNQKDAEGFACFLASMYNGGGVPQRYEVLKGDDPDTATVVDYEQPETPPAEQPVPTGAAATSDAPRAKGHRQQTTPDASPASGQGE